MKNVNATQFTYFSCTTAPRTGLVKPLRKELAVYTRLASPAFLDPGSLLRMKPQLVVSFLCLSSLGPSALALQPELLELSLEELVQIPITATKREQPWVDIAATVDVFEGAQLRDQGIYQLRELAEAAPGLVYGRVGNTPNIYLRGIGSDLMSVAADASTAVYQDEVYLARPEMSLAHFWDIERIEILKGPQGALYGRNATGGAINIISSRPSFTHTQGYARAGLGSFHNRQLEAAVGGPLNDSLALRLSGLVIQDQGYTEDLDPRGGDELDNNKVAALRLEGRWQIRARLETSLSGFHYQNNSDGFSLTPADQRGLADQLGALPTPGFHQLRNDLPSFSDYETQGLNWRLDWQGEGFDLQSISAYRALDSRYLLNTDGTEIAVTESQVIWSQRQRSQELRLISTAESSVQWLVGANWLDETPTLDVGLVRHPLLTSILINAHAKTRAWGVYGELDWRFMPQWTLTLGLRTTREHRRDGNQFLSTGDLMGLDSDLRLARLTGTSEHQASYEKPSPQVIVSFAPLATRAQDLAYFSATQGFKSGGANSLSTRPAFRPEEITSLEAGYNYSRGKLVWHLAGFHYDYQDLQVITYEAGTTTITNAASATLHGLDASLRWAPNYQWHYQLGLALLDAHYGRFITSLAAAPKDVSGNPMPFAPGWDINQTLSYQPTPSWKIAVQHHFQSRSYYNQFEDPSIASSGHHLFDLRLSRQLDPHWELAAGIDNLTNEDYYQNLTRFTSTSPGTVPQGNALGVTAPGRRWLLELNYRY